MNVSSLPRQAVILAAGKSSRFEPFTDRPYHKSVTELMGKPLIVRTVESLRELGIQDIFVIHAPEDTSLREALENHLVTFVVQETPKGAGNALLIAKEQLYTGSVLVVNPQQVNMAEHLAVLEQKEFPADSVVLFSQTTDMPQKYGMLQLEGDRVTGVKEKPSSAESVSDQRILGIYILTSQFLEFLSQTKTEEYQLEAALDEFAKNNHVFAAESQAGSCSLKYVWDLFSISELLFSQFHERPAIHPDAMIHRTAIIEGPVVIEEGAQIYEHALIKGPCYIGRNAVVGSYCKVRGGSVLEEGAEVQSHAEVKHSILGKRSHMHSGFIGDSLIGEDVRIGAGFITANRRFDRQAIKVTIKNERISTGMTAFGALIGDRASIGIHSGTNPGVIVPAQATVMPGTILSPSKN